MTPDYQPWVFLIVPWALVASWSWHKLGAQFSACTFVHGLAIVWAQHSQMQNCLHQVTAKSALHIGVWLLRVCSCIQLTLYFCAECKNPCFAVLPQSWLRILLLLTTFNLFPKAAIPCLYQVIEAWTIGWPNLSLDPLQWAHLAFSCCCVGHSTMDTWWGFLWARKRVSFPSEMSALMAKKADDLILQPPLLCVDYCDTSHVVSSVITHLLLVFLFHCRSTDVLALFLLDGQMLAIQILWWSLA